MSDLKDKYPTVTLELYNIGAEFIAEYRTVKLSRTLSQADTIVDSMEPEVIADTNALNLAIGLIGYWYYAEYGRGPGKQPPLDNMVSWVERTGLAGKVDSEGNTISVRSLAYLIARKIGREGTEGKHIIETIIQNNRERWISRISNAAQLDIQKMINNIFTNLS